MKTFCSYIEKLLVNQGRAVVLGLGTFYVEKQSARVVGNVMLSPRLAIKFDASCISDNSLVEQYMRYSAGGEELAKKEIERCVVAIKQELESRGECELPYVGKLVKFGGQTTLINGVLRGSVLPSVQLVPIEKQTDKPAGNDKNQIVLSFPRSVARYAAIFVVLLSISGIIPAHREGDDAFASLLQHKVQAMAELKELEIEKVLAASGDFESEEVEVAEEEQATVQPNETNAVELHYHIVVASLCSREQAETYVEQRGSGTIMQCGDKYRITTESFATIDEANAAIEQVRAEVPKAWILKK